LKEKEKLFEKNNPKKMLKHFIKSNFSKTKLKNKQLENSRPSNSIFTLINSKGGLSNHNYNQNYNQNNIDFGQSILTNTSLDDEFNFDRLGPFEKLCSLCDNPTPSNM